MIRDRLLFLLSFLVAASCADFIGPDPEGAGGNNTTTTSAETVSSAGGFGGGGASSAAGGGGGGAVGVITALSVGLNHACAVASGTLYCWGNNDEGAVAPGQEAGCQMPLPVAIAGETFADVGAGDKHTCALSTDGDVFCWGTNDKAQISGDGQAGVVNLQPARPIGPLPASQLSVGANHTCAVIDGLVWCWGDNAARQAIPGDRATPVGVDTPLTIQEIMRPTPVAAGNRETCIWSGNDVACFGGEAGIHGRDETACGGSGPGVFSLRQDVDTLSVGGRQACARFLDGTYECWGGAGSTCTTSWCAMAGCVLEGGGPVDVVTSSEDFWCHAGSGTVACTAHSVGSTEAPEPKLLAELGMTSVTLLSASGSGFVCASDSTKVACWGSQPAATSVLCNVSANEVVSFTFP